MGHIWGVEEDQQLMDLVRIHGKQWGLIASLMKNRTASQVSSRWEKCLDPIIIKGPFSLEEDEKIKKFVNINGPHNWPKITDYLPNRSPKQCRERWFNHLDPNVIKDFWSPEEDEIIFEQYQMMGPKWSKIAKYIPGRTDNAIKNRWNSSISKRISKKGGSGACLLPQVSKRKPKTISQQISSSASNELPKLTIPIPFEPFSVKSFLFTQLEYQLNSPASPIPGFSSTPGAFGGLGTPTASFVPLVSP